MDLSGLKIILGSASLNRRQVFAEMCEDFEVMSADIDEKAIRFDDPSDLVLALAEAKAEALLGRMDKRADILITADQVVVCNGEIREKPENEKVAREYLESYGKYPAETYSAVMVTNIATGKKAKSLDIAKVYFNPIPQGVIDEVVRKGDVFRVAGGFTIEDDLFGPYVKRVEGASDSILGLPKELVLKLAKEVL